MREMKKLVFVVNVLINSLVFQVLNVGVVYAQTATPSSESTSSTLPEAGTFTTTLFLIVFGLILLVLGTTLLVKQGRLRS